MAYQSARKLKQAGKYSEARREFAKLGSAAFIIGDYAAYDLARMEMEDRRPAEALSIMNTMLERYPDTPLQAKANELRVRAACADAGMEKCGEYLELIGAADVPNEFAPERLFIEGTLKLKEGDAAGAHAVFMDIYLSYPASSAASKAKAAIDSIESGADETLRENLEITTINQRMERAEKLKAAYKYTEAAEELESVIESATPPHQRESALLKLGEAYNKGRERKKALDRYQRLLDEFPKSSHAAWAMYHMASIQWNLDMGGEALETASKLIKAEPTCEAAGKARILMGKIAEARGDFPGARSHYSRALAMGLAPAAEDEIRWKLGWVEYRQGKFKEAAKYFQRAAEKAGSFNNDGKLLYWAARAQSRAGDGESASALMATLTRKHPRTYYGTMAEGIGESAVDMADIDPVTGAFTAPPAHLAEEALRRYQRFEMLAQIGHMEGARMEAGAIGGLTGGGSEETLWLASLYRRAGAADQSIRLLTSPIFAERAADYTDPYWRAVYPVSHWEIIRGASASRGISPFMTLAIIKQESAFNPGALSPANARGLMQLIPSTGKVIFEKTGSGREPAVKFDPLSLFDPETNVTLGAAYFQELVARYKGNLPRAIAAYNAGAPAVDRWDARFGNHDDDEFVELIPYLETREYVKKVMRNMVLYRRIYAPSARPDPAAEAGLKSAKHADEN